MLVTLRAIWCVRFVNGLRTLATCRPKSTESVIDMHARAVVNMRARRGVTRTSMSVSARLKIAVPLLAMT